MSPPPMSGITFSGFEVASATMTYATNALDGRHIYFEDEGGHGSPVVIHGGFLDPIELVRASPLAGSLEPHREEFRFIYVDHRGPGNQDEVNIPLGVPGRSC
jgi:pimeloyl-ACP methyl ester carboxylesterase